MTTPIFIIHNVILTSSFLVLLSTYNYFIGLLGLSFPYAHKLQKTKSLAMVLSISARAWHRADVQETCVE